MNGRNVAIMEFGSSRITCIIGAKGVNNTFNIRGYGDCDYAGYEVVCTQSGSSEIGFEFQDRADFFEPQKVAACARHALNLAEENAAVKVTKLYVGVPPAFCVLAVRNAALSLDRKRKITEQDVGDLLQQGVSSLGSLQVGRSIISCVPAHFVLDDNRKVASAKGMLSNRLSAPISYVLADNNFTHFVSAMARDIGVQRVEYLSSIISEYLYLFDESARDGYSVLVDVGLIVSSVALCKDGSVIGLRSYEMGGGHISGALMTEFGIESFQVAEQLKRKIVLTLDAKEGDMYTVTHKGEKFSFDAAAAGEVADICVNGIADTIKDAIASFEVDLPDYLQVNVTGGGINYIRGAKEALARGIGYRVEFVKPTIPRLNKPELSSELGVLCAAIKDDEAIVGEKSLFLRLTNFLRR